MRLSSDALTIFIGELKNEATGTCIDHGFRPKPGEQGKLVPCNGKVTQR